MDRDAERPFTIDEPDDPERIEAQVSRLGGFLLIVRTSRIVTAHAVIVPKGCDSEDEYRWILGVSSIQRSLITASKSTVIVTAAIHRGLGSELRLAANPSP